MIFMFSILRISSVSYHFHSFVTPVSLDTKAPVIRNATANNGGKQTSSSFKFAMMELTNKSISSRCGGPAGHNFAYSQLKPASSCCHSHTPQKWTTDPAHKMKTGLRPAKKQQKQPENHPRRLGRPPVTGHQRAKVLADMTRPEGMHPNLQMLPTEPAVSGNSIWCVFYHLISLICTDS
jgi:hypothetical protein